MTITNNGKTQVRNWLASQVLSGSTSTVDSLTRIAVGSGTTAAIVTNTNLENTIDIKAFNSAPDTTITREVTFVGFWSSQQINSNTISEVGLFTLSGGGTLFSRSVFDGFDKDNTIELEIDSIVEVK